MIGLTEVQAKCLTFIKTRIEERGCPPSFREMADHFGFRSISRIYTLMDSLEQRGAIRRLHGQARAIELVDQSEINTALSILTSDVRDVVIRIAKAENTQPEIIMAEWCRERAEHERYQEELSA